MEMLVFYLTVKGMRVCEEAEGRPYVRATAPLSTTVQILTCVAWGGRGGEGLSADTLAWGPYSLCLI